MNPDRVRMIAGAAMCAGQLGVMIGGYVLWARQQATRGPIDRSRARAPRPRGSRGTFLLGKGQVDPMLSRQAK